MHPLSLKDATPFPELLHFSLDPYLIMLSVKQGGIKYHFFFIEPWFSGPLVNTLLIKPMVWCVCVCVYVCVCIIFIV